MIKSCLCITRKWLRLWKARIISYNERYYQEYNRLARNLKHIEDNEDLAVMRDADVIAMTTTGAAKHRAILSQLEVNICFSEIYIF